MRQARYQAEASAGLSALLRIILRWSDDHLGLSDIPSIIWMATKQVAGLSSGNFVVSGSILAPPKAGRTLLTTI
jgi:hypothetical protein